MRPKIILEEQGPRDGFQVEKLWIPTEMKVYYINKLAEAGLKRIQITSFVNPKLVPQMADSVEVTNIITIKEGVTYSALVLNTKGVERALETKIQNLSISLSASETHSSKNTGKGIRESVDEIFKAIYLAQFYKIKVRAGIQCAFGCRYEGKIKEKVVLNLVEFLLTLGVKEIALADSTGMGNPKLMKAILKNVNAIKGKTPINIHLHDTEGKGFLNLMAAIEMGVTRFDTAFGGLGGCPFIKGATGNIATEDTVSLLEELGFSTGIDKQKIIALSKEIENFLGKKLPGKIKEL